MTESEYEKLCREAEDALRPKLTPEFLAVLREAIRTYGWWGDMVETAMFGEWCYLIAGVERPKRKDWEPTPDPGAIDIQGPA